MDSLYGMAMVKHEVFCNRIHFMGFLFEDSVNNLYPDWPPADLSIAH